MTRNPVIGPTIRARDPAAAHPMNVKIISCWFATSYGAYTDGLRRALERRLGSEVGIIATNCGCGDPIEVRRQFQDRRCEYFELPNVGFHKSPNALKYWLRTRLRSLLCWERTRRLHRRDGAAEVLHFQQILNATGSATVFHWLGMPSRAARVVTVHELDSCQLAFPKSNLRYNLADRIIVHCQEMKDSLCGFGVDGQRIDVVQHGVEIRPLVDGPREGIIFYGGHFLERGKGFDTLLETMRLLKDRLGAGAEVDDPRPLGRDQPQPSLAQAARPGSATTCAGSIRSRPTRRSASISGRCSACSPILGALPGTPPAWRWRMARP